jgi:6-pyruvoyl-tetrahydropterin synthase related domain
VTQPAVDLSTRRAGFVLAAAAIALLAAGIPQYVGSGASYGNDASSHFAEIVQVADLLAAGESDFWFDGTNLGYPLFLAYQPAPAFVMGALVAATRSFVSPLLLFRLSVLGLWCLMPVAWYIGGRWLGLRRIEAVLFALLILGVNDFRSFGLGLSSTLANGLYTQLWGALFLPLALGSLYRCVMRQEPGVARPVLFLTLTLLCHVFLALYCGIAAGLLVVVQWEGLWRRARTLLVIGAWTALASAFWLVPFLVNLPYQGGLPWKHESENGYPPGSLLRWTFTGDFFDYERLPWLTLLIVIGIVLAWLRRSRPLERWALLLFAVTFALLMGRTTWGTPYGWIPFHGELEVIRYLTGLQLCGALFGAWAAAAALDRLPRLTESLSGPAWLTPERTQTAIATLLVLGYLLGLNLHSRTLLRTFDTSQPDFRGAVDHLSQERGSRFLSHARLGTASHFYLNLLASLSGRPQLQSFSRGYHDTLSLYYLEYFDFSEAEFRLYNVGAALVRGERSKALPSSFHETWSGGDLAIFESDASGGYFAFVRTPITLVNDAKQARRLLRRIALPLFEVNALPRLVRDPPPESWWRWLGGNRIEYVAAAGDPPREAPLDELLREQLRSHANQPIRSRVLDQRVSLNEYTATVDATGGDERLLLKASFHPYWTAAVDGSPEPIDLVAPNLMAISVPPGRHEIRFHYRNPPYQKLLFAGSLAGALVYAGISRLRRR